MGELPQEVIARFKASAKERLAAVEAAWSALSHGNREEEQEAQLHRQLHTLKGDARVVGFTDVNLVCQKLEDVFFLARQRGYRVSDELDMVVTMALQFMGLLVRKRQGASLGGIDLGGFIAQMDEAIRAAYLAAPQTPQWVKGEQADTEVSGDRLSLATRERLAGHATRVFVESLRANGAAADRLRVLFRELSHEVRSLGAMRLDELLTRHVAATADLARDLGKNVVMTAELSELTAARPVVEALDVAVLHASRNAVDHGIEDALERAAAGKPTLGTVTLLGRELGAQLELVLKDDGRGIDFERVRRRAIAGGLLSEQAAPLATEPELLELLFHPCFSTRDEVTEVSGRGIGLDAVRAAVARVHGTVALKSTAGRGTTLTLRVPRQSSHLSVHRFAGPRPGVTLAVPSTWNVSTQAFVLDHETFDPSSLLGLERGSSGARRVLVFRRDGKELRCLAHSAATLATAERLCPTGDSEAFEIISSGGAEAICLRPEVLIRQRETPLLTSRAG